MPLSTRPGALPEGVKPATPGLPPMPSWPSCPRPPVLPWANRLSAAEFVLMADPIGGASAAAMAPMQARPSRSRLLADSGIVCVAIVSVKLWLIDMRWPWLNVVIAGPLPMPRRSVSVKGADDNAAPTTSCTPPKVILTEPLKLRAGKSKSTNQSRVMGSIAAALSSKF